jgi:hypothetical protein
MHNVTNVTGTILEDFDTARIVFYSVQFVAFIFATLLVCAVRDAPSFKAFHNEGTRAKAAFRLVLFAVGIGDMIQTASVVPYVVDYYTPQNTNGCAVAAAMSSTGILLSALFTACLSFEGFLIVSRGYRDGEKFRAVAYVVFTVVCVVVTQSVSGLYWGFGASQTEGKFKTYMWCHLKIKTTLSELLSMYVWLILAFVVCLGCYLHMEFKLRDMLRFQGMNEGIRKTLNRSRLKFLMFPLIFVFSWIPTGIHRVVTSSTDQQCYTPACWFLIYFAGLTAEGLPIWNCLFFCVFNSSARESLKALFQNMYCCCCCRSNDGRNSSNSRFSIGSRESDASVDGWGERSRNGLSAILEDSDEEDNSRFNANSYSFGLQDGGNWQDDDDDLPPEFVYDHHSTTETSLLDNSM